MIKQDWLMGIKDSLSIDKILIHRTQRINKHMYEILICNLVLYVLPYIVFGNSLAIIIHPIGTLVHFVKYFDLVGASSTLNLDNTLLFDGTDLLSLALLMIIYQIIVQVSVSIIWMMFRPLAFAILLFYHSFYCFNNIWQCQGVPLATRTKRIELRWAYYGGYATLVTVLYVWSNNLIICAIYNIVFACNIIIAFISKPPTDKQYVPLNLSMFSYLTRISVHLVTKMLNRE